MPPPKKQKNERYPHFIDNTKQPTLLSLFDDVANKNRSIDMKQVTSTYRNYLMCCLLVHFTILSMFLLCSFVLFPELTLLETLVSPLLVLRLMLLGFSEIRRGSSVDVFRLKGVGVNSKCIRFFWYYPELWFWIVTGFINSYLMQPVCLIVRFFFLYHHENYTTAIWFILLDLSVIFEFPLTVTLLYSYGIYGNVVNNCLSSQTQNI